MKPLPPCIFPSVTEQDVVTVPGTEPCTAYRLRVEPGVRGYLRIEQLAYNEAMGWYTQKSFCLPGDVVHQLMPHLKQASALLPLPARGGSNSQAVAGSMSLHTQPAHHNAAQQVDDMNGFGSDVDMNIDTAPLRFPGPVASAATVTPTDQTPSTKNTQRKTS